MYCFYNIVNITDFSDSDYEYCLSLMTEERKSRVERLRFADDRKRTTAGELVAREMIASLCGVPRESIVFFRTEKGKPIAKDLPVYFSVSHSGEHVLCAVGDSPVGADIERIREVNEKLIERVCTLEEMRFIDKESTSADDRMRLFFRFWTAKEAYIKRIGTCIFVPPDINITDIEISKNLTCFYYGNYAVSLASEIVPVNYSV